RSRLVRTRARHLRAHAAAPRRLAEEPRVPRPVARRRCAAARRPAGAAQRGRTRLQRPRACGVRDAAARLALNGFLVPLRARHSTAGVAALMTTSPRAPILHAGDRLTRDEFERRYAAMPDLKKAELIEGVVYMGSAVRYDRHGRPERLLSLWLGVYEFATPGIGGVG